MDLYKRSRGEGFGAEVKRRIMIGTYVLSAGYYDAYYLKAQKVRQLITADFTRAFAEVDVLIGPTTPTPAFAIGAKTVRSDHDVLERHLHDRREPRRACRRCRFPAGSCKGLPVGLQIVGPHFSEAQAAECGACFSARDGLAYARAGAIRMSARRRSGKQSSGWRSTPSSRRSSKIFSGSPIAYGAPPNAQANLVDLGLSGRAAGVECAKSCGWR